MSTTTKTEEAERPAKKTRLSSREGIAGGAGVAHVNGDAAGHDSTGFTAFETSLFQSMEKASVRKKMGEYFVPVADHNDLKEDHNELKEEHNELKEEHNELKGRLDHMAHAFGPGIEFALFETAVYESLKGHLAAVDPTLRENAKFGLASLCNACLTKLLGNSTKKIQWAGPSARSRVGPVLLKPDRKALVLRALMGLEQYVIKEDTDVLKRWPLSEGRNLVTHNGSLLDCLCVTPTKNPKGEYESVGRFAMVKEKVKRSREEFESAVASASPKSTVRDAIDAIVAALGGKSISVDDADKNSVIGDLSFV